MTRNAALNVVDFGKASSGGRRVKISTDDAYRQLSARRDGKWQRYLKLQRHSLLLTPARQLVN